ncbi:hypothetical protein HG530_013329 [Fusarium avenaceum]|nr:hypothetical protein HG530_013329 [Fusarium avenaceum]
MEVRIIHTVVIGVRAEQVSKDIGVRVRLRSPLLPQLIGQRILDKLVTLVSVVNIVVRVDIRRHGVDVIGRIVFLRSDSVIDEEELGMNVELLLNPVFDLRLGAVFEPRLTLQALPVIRHGMVGNGRRCMDVLLRKCGLELLSGFKQLLSVLIKLLLVFISAHVFVALTILRVI